MDYSKMHTKNDLGKGGLMMHISNFNSISVDDFKGAFRTKEIIDFALSSSCNHVWNIVGEHTARARKLIEDLREDLGAPKNTSVTSSSPVVHSHPSPQNIPTQRVILRQEISKPQILKTNMGEFKSLDTLKENMRVVYPLIPEKRIDNIFESSKVELGLGFDVEYLEPIMFKGMVKIVKIKCDEGILSLLSGEVDEEEEQEDEDVSSTVALIDKATAILEAPEEEGFQPTMESHPYILHSPNGPIFFKTWSEAMKGQKEFNQSNKTKLRAAKRVKRGE